MVGQWARGDAASHKSEGDASADKSSADKGDHSSATDKEGKPGHAHHGRDGHHRAHDGHSGGPGSVVFYKDVEANQFVIPGSNYHLQMTASARLKSIFDNETWFDVALPEVTSDPLKFRDEQKYADRIKDARVRTGLKDAIKIGYGRLEGVPVVIAVQDFDFMAGTLATAAGEAILHGFELAVEKHSPFIVFAASGGARLQEGVLSLMQMPRTTVGVQMLRDAKLPYIVVLTHPTTGGVTASYAMLGDVQIAEPGALIGFAGPRVIERPSAKNCRNISSAPNI